MSYEIQAVVSQYQICSIAQNSETDSFLSNQTSGKMAKSSRSYGSCCIMHEKYQELN